MYNSLKKINENWRIFPNTVALGYYSFFTQSVHLSSLDKIDIDELIKLFEFRKKNGINLRQYQLVRKTLSILHHEYTHWIDNISTIWGTNLLIKVFNAVKLREDAIKGNDDISEYYKIKELKDLTKRIAYSNYYTTLQDVENQYPWISNYSIGKLFSKNGKISKYPIIFTRFITNKDHEIICRVPFSLSSILESSAMAQEIHTDNMALNSLQEDIKLIEVAEYKREILSTVYNKDLCVYNVAAHHIANCLKLSDIFAAYKICSILGRFVLNFPSSLFVRIKVPSKHISALTEGKNTKIWLDGFKVAFDHKDRGILFFLIGTLLTIQEDQKELKNIDITNMIKNALSKINISMQDVEKETTKEIVCNFEILNNNNNNEMSQYIACAGKNIFDQMGVFGKYPYAFHDLAPIPAILGDDSILALYGNPLSFDLYNYVFGAMDIEPHIQEFDDACVF